MKLKFRIAICMFILLTATVAQAQKTVKDTIALFDALYINGLDSGGIDSFIVTINKYVDTAIDANLDSSTTQSKLNGNPYLQKYVSSHWATLTAQTKTTPPLTVEAQKNKMGGTSAKATTGPIPAGNLLGANWQSTIILGLSNFIADRAKQEMVISVLDQFNDKLNTDDPKEKEIFRDLRNLFPQTGKTLNAISKFTTNYQAYLSALKESFQKDLNALPDNLIPVIKSHDTFFKKLPDKYLEPLIINGLTIASDIEHGTSPVKIVAEFDLSGFQKDSLFFPSIQTLQTISNSLRDTGNDLRWTNKTNLEAVFNNSDALNLYLGLLLQNFKKENVVFTFKDTNVIVATALKNIDGDKNNLGLIKTFIYSVAQKTAIVETAYQDIATKEENNGLGANPDATKVELFSKVFSASIELLREITNIQKIPLFSEVKISDKMERLLDVSQSMDNMIVDINRRNYRSLITEVFNVYNDIALSNGADNIDYATGNTDKVKPKNTMSSVMTDIFKFGNIVAVLSDTSADQVENDLETLLPVGTYRDKRDHLVNISVNAYCGFFGGYEKDQGVDKPFDFSQFNTTGVTAPVGISLTFGNWGIRKNFLSRWFCKENPATIKSPISISIFASVLDLGAITAMRYGATTMPARTGNDTATVAGSPNIQFKDVFSPGLFVGIGIPRCPISVNFGVQMGPNLRNITPSSNGTNAPNYADGVYWRYSISACVDVPLLNLHTSAR